MKFNKKFAAAIITGIIMMTSTVTLAEPIPIRGIVEGFYGTPWSHENRIDMFEFCGSHGFNAYIYAPKDDPYHRSKWREAYPNEKLKEISNLVQSAKANNVKFIFAVSPGLDLNYSSEEELQTMITKLTTMYKLGVRDFAIFFDDIEDKDGGAQAQFLNLIQEKFIKIHEDISPLITVPTEYFRKDMIDDSGRKPYTLNFLKTLSPEIIVLYTGEGVVQPELNDEQYKAANDIYERSLGIWWNYPVNDYMEDKLALGPIEKLPKHSSIPAIFFNPMKFANLSKISLATGADYAKNPTSYNSEESWNRAIEEQFGELAEEMKRFASCSQHLENNWAKIGPPDTDLLKATHDQLKILRKSIKDLRKKLPKNILAECQPQLENLEIQIDEKLKTKK